MNRIVMVLGRIGWAIILLAVFGWFLAALATTAAK